MRALLSIVLLILSSLRPVFGGEALPVIKDTDAVKYVGKNVEVHGQVVSAYIGRRGDAYIFFGAGYPNQTFTGYIPAGWTFSGGAWTLKLQGQIISIVGTVELYRGKPEIEILSMDQIKQPEERPKAK